jgi:integrase
MKRKRGKNKENRCNGKELLECPEVSGRIDSRQDRHGAQNDQISGYSSRTIKSYTICAKNIYKHFKKPLNKITESGFKNFLEGLVKKKYSPYTLNLYHATLKYVIEKIYRQRFDYRFACAKRPKRLPVVLSRKDIKTLVNSIKNHKYRLMIGLAYGAGLRVSEIVNLRIKDLNLNELTIHIKSGKGRKDRITIVPGKLKTGLQNLIAGKRGGDFVFERKRGGN